MDLSAAEAELLRTLERRVYVMFYEYTGWDADVDDDARKAVRGVQRAIRALVAFREVQSAVSAGG